jgi:predicted nucleic-acid-binding Zn-ribbon protein
MKNKSCLILIFLIFYQTNAQTSIFNDLLQKHVTKNGIVDYTSLKTDESKLDNYISYLKKIAPEKSWSKNKQKAFWINVYNAYTIKIILNKYPLKSILDIKEDGKNAWKIPFVKVGSNLYTLDHIEHQILRKTLFDPRIHVGVNCASGSCPKLGNKAFTEENIERTLEKLMREFVNDSSRNKFLENEIQISSIFDWFQEDFTKNGSLIEYLNKYSETKINSNAKISYLKYDWSLNSK